MKKMKKIFALLLALTMVLGMSTTVFAADGDEQKGTITVENTSAKVGKYVQANDGDLKYDAAKAKYVQIKEGETVAAADRFKYVEVDNSYKAYRIFQASPADDGDDKTSPSTTWAATETTNHVSYLATPAQVSALTGVAVAELTNECTGAGGCFKFTKTAAGDYLVTLVEGKTAKDVAQYFNTNFATLAQNTTAFPATDLTVTGGKATASVDYGYYFVTSTNGSVVSIDTTNKNVVINDKNTYNDPFNPGEDDDPSNDDLKNITKINGQTNTNGHDDTTASIGDILTYEIKNNTSNYVVKDGTSKKVSYVYVNDTIGKGLTYVTNDTYKFTVKVGNTELTKADAAFSSQTAGSLKYYIIEKTEADPYNGDAFTVVIPWLYADGNLVFDDNAVVTVTYSAKLNEYVEEVAGQDASDSSANKADIKYDLADPDGEPDPENPPAPDPGQGGSNTGVKEDTVKVLVYAVAIQKYDGASKAALAGAHFEVKSGDTVIGAVPVKADGTVAGANDTVARYMYDSTNTAATTGYTTDFVTDANGQIIIYGVKGGTYTVKETTAPMGYNLMKDTADIDASVAGEKVTTTTLQVVTYYVQDSNGDYKKDGENFVKLTDEEMNNYQGTRYSVSDTKTEGATEVVEASFTSPENVSYVNIENNKGSELPSTGGIGTTIFYVLGSVLVIFAGVVLVTRRRMSVN